jgi:hypothetical protein
MLTDSSRISNHSGSSAFLARQEFKEESCWRHFHDDSNLSLGNKGRKESWTDAIVRRGWESVTSVRRQVTDV